MMAGCASGGRAFPPSTEPAPHVLGRAIAAIADAVSAGADSLAPDALKLARQRVAAATVEEQSKHGDRAVLSAREALADAAYAKASAERTSAERAQQAAAAALDASPAPARATPGGPGER